ncbi:hypothetical protein L7F22_030992 [Adiantum nelumboides]|nr:hypothetical protein [Adiantum nelumboides]
MERSKKTFAGALLQSMPSAKPSTWESYLLQEMKKLQMDMADMRKEMIKKDEQITELQTQVLAMKTQAAEAGEGPMTETSRVEVTNQVLKLNSVDSPHFVKEVISVIKEKEMIEDKLNQIRIGGLPSGTEIYQEKLVRALAKHLKASLLILDSDVLAAKQCKRDTHDTSTDSAEIGIMPPEGSEIWTINTTDDEDGNDEEDSSNKKTVSAGPSIFQTLGLMVKQRGKPKTPKVTATAVHVNKSDDDSSEEEESQSQSEAIKIGDHVRFIDSKAAKGANKRGSPRVGQQGLVMSATKECPEAFGVQFERASSRKTGGSSKENRSFISVCNVKQLEKVDAKCSEEVPWIAPIEAFAGLGPSPGGTIVYFPDLEKWMAKAVSKDERNFFVHTLADHLDSSKGPVLFITGRRIRSTSGNSNDRDEFHALRSFLTSMRAQFRKAHPHMKGGADVKGTEELFDIFKNVVPILPPQDNEALRKWREQLDEDTKELQLRNNVVEIEKVLSANSMSCKDVAKLDFSDLILTEKQAQKIVGWARNIFLNSNEVHPKGKTLFLSRKSLELAVTRFRALETTPDKQSDVKALAGNTYERELASSVVRAKDIGVTFEQIGALEEVKTTLKELIILPLKRPELFSKGNLRKPCKGVLLFGPPGTGKTLLAKAVATEAGANFMSVSASSLTCKYFGESEKLAKSLFSLARKLEPAIIFIDEVDGILRARGDDHEHEASRRVRNELMAAWDGLQSKDQERILVLATTNRPFDLDDAVIRRLPRRIFIDLPNAINREKILHKLLLEEDLSQDFDFGNLAAQTEGFSGSDLKNLCVAAAYRPIQEFLEAEKQGSKNDTIKSQTGGQVSLRPLCLDDFIQAKVKVQEKGHNLSLQVQIQPCFGAEFQLFFSQKDVRIIGNSAQSIVGDLDKFRAEKQDQFWGCYVAKILPDRCYTAGYRPTSWFHRWDKSLFPQRVRRELLWVKAYSEHRVFIMADKRDEEGSSSLGTERVSHDDDALFKAQLVSFMETFQQLSKHPKMQELLQASKSPTQTQKASSQSLQSPGQSRSGHLQRKETSKEQRSNDTKGKGHVVEQPPVSIGHGQPSTHGLVEGQDSNEQTMRQTIPLPMSNAGCFGGGSVFQAMIRPSPALHGFMPDNAYGAMPPSGSNPMRFIRHFAEIASPLHALTHKGVTFKWTTKEITAFKHLKEKLTSDPVIILPDLLKPFVVQCDACGNNLGAVLMQDGRVVAYESRVFCYRARTLQIYEKQMLAVMHALYSWKHFLLGADFIVQTDHQTLRYFLTQGKLSEQHMRWANFLSMFHFRIVHVEVKKNVVVDALSRKPQVSAVSISYHNELEEMKGQYVEDKYFARIYDQIINGQRREHYSLKSDFFMMHGKLCVTKQLRPKVLIECHAPPYAGHRGIDATVKAIDTFFYWPTLKRHVDAFVRSCLVCQKVKFDRQKAPGLLQPLPIPDKPWESIAMDFIFYLPRTPTGNDGIWTIICRFNKQAHFVPVRKKIKLDHMVKLFMHNIFKYHGIPQSVVSDRFHVKENERQGTSVSKAGYALLWAFSKDIVPEEQPEVEELDEILVPEQILAHKDRKVRGKVVRRYLVKFKNYSPMDAKWMEEAALVDSPQLLQLYLEAFQLQPKVT